MYVYGPTSRTDNPEGGKQWWTLNTRSTLTSMPREKQSRWNQDMVVREIRRTHEGWKPWERFPQCHHDVIKWKHFPRYWPFVRGIHRWPVNSPHKGQWHEALMFSLICAWIKSWANDGDAGDLRRHRAHHDAIVMCAPMEWDNTGSGNGNVHRHDTAWTNSGLFLVCSEKELQHNFTTKQNVSRVKCD